MLQNALRDRCSCPGKRKRSYRSHTAKPFQIPSADNASFANPPSRPFFIPDNTLPELIFKNIKILPSGRQPPQEASAPGDFSSPEITRKPGLHPTRSAGDSRIAPRSRRKWPHTPSALPYGTPPAKNGHSEGRKAFPRGEGGFKIANTLAILKTDEGCRAASFRVAYVAGFFQCRACIPAGGGTFLFRQESTQKAFPRGLRPQARFGAQPPQGGS